MVTGRQTGLPARRRAPDLAYKKWVVDLTDEERTMLDRMLGKGKAAVRRLTRARILLAAAEDRPDEAVAAALHSTAQRWNGCDDGSSRRVWRRHCASGPVRAPCPSSTNAGGPR